VKTGACPPNRNSPRHPRTRHPPRRPSPTPHEGILPGTFPNAPGPFPNGPGTFPNGTGMVPDSGGLSPFALGPVPPCEGLSPQTGPAPLYAGGCPPNRGLFPTTPGPVPTKKAGRRPRIHATPAPSPQEDSPPQHPRLYTGGVLLQVEKAAHIHANPLRTGTAPSTQGTAPSTQGTAPSARGQPSPHEGQPPTNGTSPLHHRPPPSTRASPPPTRTPPSSHQKKAGQRPRIHATPAPSPHGASPRRTRDSPLRTRANPHKQGLSPFALGNVPARPPIHPWSFAQQNSRSGAMPRVRNAPRLYTGGVLLTSGEGRAFAQSPSALFTPGTSARAARPN
jgi:hypothetical protein